MAQEGRERVRARPEREPADPCALFARAVPRYDSDATEYSSTRCFRFLKSPGASMSSSAKARVWTLVLGLRGQRALVRRDGSCGPLCDFFLAFETRVGMVGYGGLWKIFRLRTWRWKSFGDFRATCFWFWRLAWKRLDMESFGTF